MRAAWYCHPALSLGTASQCRSSEVGLNTHPVSRHLHGVNLGRGRQAEGRGHWEDLFAFGVPCPCSLIVIISLWPELSCNFEKGMCGWYQDQSSDFKWVRGTGQGQGSDHTTGSGKGLAPFLGAPGSPGHPQPPVPSAGMCPWGETNQGQAGDTRIQVEGAGDVGAALSTRVHVQSTLAVPDTQATS